MEVLGRLRLSAVAFAAAVASFLAVGGLGVHDYGLNYWLYRGYLPPHDPTWVTRAGLQDQFALASPALGGRKQDVYTYLPPGYETSHRRYPVIYLLHGFPGRPTAFLQTVRMGVIVDEYAARNAAKAAILVMPSGSTGTFTDKEWVNGIGRNEGWATFVSRDLVRAVDARYRTIPTGRGRAIAGLSEGGYGAINIALHNPGEFSVVQSWSGYTQPDRLRSIYGSHLQLVGPNDPVTLLPQAAATLRRTHTFFWFYSGRKDPFRVQNRAFAAELARLGIAHRYFEAAGGHNWAIWRAMAMPAYTAAMQRLAHA